MIRHAWLAVLAVVVAAFGQSGTFLLGVDGSKPVGSGFLNPSGVAVDGNGFIYILVGVQSAANFPAGATVLGASATNSYVQKLTPDGGAVVWSTVLGFPAVSFAVDSAGGVYVAGTPFGQSSGSLAEKLQPDGKALAWEIPIGVNLLVNAVEVDPAGRLYVAGVTQGGGLASGINATPNAWQKTVNAQYKHAFVLRVNAAGSALDYATYVSGSNTDFVTQLAFDGAGEAVLVGLTLSPDFPATSGSFNGTAQGSVYVPFAAKLSADGSALAWSMPAGQPGDSAPGVAIDAAGNIAVAGYGSNHQTFNRYTPAGTLMSSQSVVSGTQASAFLFGPDAAGNIYLSSETLQGNLPVKNNVASCAPNLLTVYGPANDVVQSTWLPVSFSAAVPALAPDSSLYFLGFSPGGQSSTLMLTHVAQSSSARVQPLACLTDPAAFLQGELAPGKIMTSFGEGIGPAQGAHPSVTMASGYPSELAGVQVTFAGQPAPILYAQSGQINVVAPWSLTPGQPASVCVTYNKASTNCLAEQVAEAAPAIFMADSTYALAVNQDGTINSAANPARPGAYVSLYGTGFGPLNPRPKDGQLIEFPLPVNLLTTTVQTTVLSFGPEITIYYHVEYAGPAPYQVAGLTQINVQAASGMSNVTAAVTDAAGNPFTSNTFAIHVAGE